MTIKLKLAVICGGLSAEHDVSIISAKNIINALDPDKYEIFVMYITKAGEWFLFDDYRDFFREKSLSSLLGSHAKHVAINLSEKSKAFRIIGQNPRNITVDVVFPVLHGPFGEDGTVQGMLDLAGISYVGAGMLSSAICMDKEMMKRLFNAANIPTPKWLVYTKRARDAIRFDEIKKHLRLPFFIKPANMGSSIGISKIKHKNDFVSAVDLAFQYDRKVIFEEFIAGREFECAVLGNAEPKASQVAEIIPQHEFYSYEAKYLDPNGAILKAPVELPAPLTEEIQTLAIKAFLALKCECMARVDFLFSKDDKAYVSEINTIPGFTEISMYPRLWVSSGLRYGELLDKLIQLAQEK